MDDFFGSSERLVLIQADDVRKQENKAGRKHSVVLNTETMRLTHRDPWLTRTEVSGVRRKSHQQINRFLSELGTGIFFKLNPKTVFNFLSTTPFEPFLFKVEDQPFYRVPFLFKYGKISFKKKSVLFVINIV